MIAPSAVLACTSWGIGILEGERFALLHGQTTCTWGSFQSTPGRLLYRYRLFLSVWYLFFAKCFAGTIGSIEQAGASMEQSEVARHTRSMHVSPTAVLCNNISILYSRLCLTRPNRSRNYLSVNIPHVFRHFRVAITAHRRRPKYFVFWLCLSVSIVEFAAARTQNTRYLLGYLFR